MRRCATWVTYLDESSGAEAIGVDPEFARRGLG